MMNSINIAVIGLGQIGSYLLNELNVRQKDIELKTGKKIKVVAITAKNINKKKQFKINKKIFFKNPIEILLVARPSLIDLNIGIPPATDASNSRLTLFCSAIFVNSLPCFEINALFGVITWILLFKAVSTIFFDTPSDCPIASNKISTFVLLKISKEFL